MTRTAARPEPLPALTSLRFFAAALIVLGHGGSPAYFAYAVRPFDVRQAVSFFFVLSGFILAHVYQHTDWRTQWWPFLGARIARVGPVHVVTALIALFTVAPVGDARGAAIALANLLLLHAAVPLTAWHYSLNAVSWSISVELYFYLVFPLLLVATLRRGWRALVIPIALSAVAVDLAAQLHLSGTEFAPGVTAWGVIYISPFTRLLEFATGILAYRLALGTGAAARRNGATPLEAGALVLCIAAMTGTTAAAEALERAGAGPVAVWVRTAAPFPFFAVLIAVLARGGGAVSRLLSLPLLVYLGEISFALYMIHQLVLRIGFLHAGALARAHPALSYALYWAIALAGAALLYHAVERPARQRLRRLLA